jgi:hypothetical protein
LAQEIYLNMQHEQGRKVRAAEAEVGPRVVLMALQKGMRAQRYSEQNFCKSPACVEVKRSYI